MFRPQATTERKTCFSLEQTTLGICTCELKIRMLCITFDLLSFGDFIRSTGGRTGFYEWCHFVELWRRGETESCSRRIDAQWKEPVHRISDLDLEGIRVRIMCQKRLIRTSVEAAHYFAPCSTSVRKNQRLIKFPLISADFLNIHSLESKWNPQHINMIWNFWTCWQHPSEC